MTARWLGGVATWLICLGVTGPAAAQSYFGLFPERHLVCRAPTERRAPPPSAVSAAPPPGALEPLGVRRPPTSAIAPRLAIDTAVLEPIPERAPSRAIVAVEAPPPPVWVEQPENDFRCLGFLRGAEGIRAVVEAPEGARFTRHAWPHVWRTTNVRGAATAFDRRLVPALERALGRAAVGEGPASFEVQDMRFQAARALGALGEPRAAATLARGLRADEDLPRSTMWAATFDALDALDPRAAEVYARDVVARVAAGRPPPGDARLMKDDALLRHALPRLRTPSAEGLAALGRLRVPADHCGVLAARLRLGDAALLRELRAELAVDLRTQRAVACYGELMPIAFPGEDPDEVDTLLHRRRLDAILSFVGRARSAPKVDARWAAGLEKLRRGLSARMKDPDLAGDASDRRFDPVARAEHLVALAALGDAAAQRAMESLFGDPAADDVAPWVALEHALRLDLPGAVPGAVRRLDLARSQHTTRHDRVPSVLRGFVELGPEERVMRALASRGDARFALGLLARDAHLREATADELGRLRPAGACAITSLAQEAESRAVQDAFWALSLLGDACLPHARALYGDSSQPDHVRGMALELRAMLRDPTVARDLDGPPRDPIRPARDRARIIHASGGAPGVIAR